MTTFTLIKVQSGGLTPAMYNQNVDLTQAAIRALQSASSNAGTVTSIGLVVPNIFSVSNSPVTTNGNITLALVSQAQNRVLASPVGASGTPTFRILTIADLPTITPSKGGNGLTSLGTAYQILRVNASGSANEYFTLTNGSSKITVTPSSGTLSIDISESNLNLASMGGIVPISKGGSGADTAQAAIKSLTQASAGAVGQVLTLDAAKNPVWSALPSIGTSQITNNSVTYAKIQTVGASKIIGNPSGSAATASEIGLGVNLLFESSTLKLKESQFTSITTSTALTNSSGIVYADSTSANVDVTLPNVSTVTLGSKITVQRINTGATNVNVRVFDESIERIEGTTSLTEKTLSGKGHTITVQYVGSNVWRVINEIN